MRLKRIVVRGRSREPRPVLFRAAGRPRVEKWGWDEDRLIRESRRVDPIEVVEVDYGPQQKGPGYTRRLLAFPKRVLRYLRS